MTTLTSDTLDAIPTTNDILVTAEGFAKLNLSSEILKALSDMNFSSPSSIQEEAIPEILKGNDIIAKAPTGSGKTAAFAIPILEKLDKSQKNIQALVLCPTRELTIQVHREFEKLTKYMENISVVSIYGGQNIDRQLNALKKQPQVIVATPGRLMDHLRRGSIKLDSIHTAVLDEADEMLDMGFREDIHTILDDANKERQTILFSATMAKDILEITKRFQKSPNIVDVTNNLENTPDIEQQYFEVSEKGKIELLTRLLDLHTIKLGLVFCNTKSNVDKVVESLKMRGYFSDAMHGDMNQAQREKVMRGFRNGSVEILVATDVAGRGIDVKNVEAVFNYDLPRDDEDYIHRVGRTGRAGNSGIAFTFVSRKQTQSLKRIERANGIQILQKEIPSFEELETSRTTVFQNKLEKMIKDEDLSTYKNEILSLSSDMELLDIAAALLKLSKKSNKKLVETTVVFDDFSDEKESRSRSRGSRGRGSRENRNRSGRDGRDGRNRSDNRGSNSRNRDRDNRKFDEVNIKSNENFSDKNMRKDSNKKKSSHKKNPTVNEMINALKTLKEPIASKKEYKEKMNGANKVKSFKKSKKKY